MVNLAGKALYALVPVVLKTVANVLGECTIVINETSAEKGIQIQVWKGKETTCFLAARSRPDRQIALQYEVVEK